MRQEYAQPAYKVYPKDINPRFFIDNIIHEVTLCNAPPVYKTKPQHLKTDGPGVRGFMLKACFLEFIDPGASQCCVEQVYHSSWRITYKSSTPSKVTNNLRGNQRLQKVFTFARDKLMTMPSYEMRYQTSSGVGPLCYLSSFGKPET